MSRKGRTKEKRSPRRTLPASGVTWVLGVAALLVVVVVVRQEIRKRKSIVPHAPALTTSPDADRSSPPAATQGAAFLDATILSGIDFVHVFGSPRAYQLPEQIGSGGAFLDYDNDGDMDLYLVQSGQLGIDEDRYKNRLYRNEGTGRFTDVSRGSGTDIGGYGMGCAAADYDRDGDVDLYVTRFGTSVMLANQGNGTFLDVTVTAGIPAPGFAASAAFFDFDNDAELDLYVTRYVDWSASREKTCFSSSGARDYCGPQSYDAPTSGRLYRNLGGGRFADVSASAGIESHEGNGLGVICNDFDGDGWVDVYVANDQTPAFLWKNLGDGTFREDAALAGAAFSADGIAIAGMGVVAEDLDEDGDYDLVVTNIRNQPHLCFRNDRGQFSDVTQIWGFGGWSVPFTGFGIALFDQDHDGRLDGIVANGAVNMHGEPYKPTDPYAEPNQFLRRDAQGRFYDASAEGGAALRVADVSRATLTADYDNDGDLDVVITRNGGPAQLLRNEQRSESAWIMLDLIPKGGGRNAINAKVEVLAGGHTYRREVRPHSGYLGSNDPRVHVGLGQATKIERLTVFWTDGSRETWPDISVNQHLTVRQGATPQASPKKNAPDLRP